MVEYPDGTSGVQPARSALREGQEKFEATGSVSVGLLSSSTTDLYTVPSGYNLYLATIIPSCIVSEVQLYGLLRDDVFIYSNTFDLAAILPLSSAGEFFFAEGEKLSIYFYNYDTSARAFYYNLVGYLEEI